MIAKAVQYKCKLSAHRPRQVGGAPIALDVSGGVSPRTPSPADPSKAVCVYIHIRQDDYGDSDSPNPRATAAANPPTTAAIAGLMAQEPLASRICAGPL